MRYACTRNLVAGKSGLNRIAKWVKSMIPVAEQTAAFCAILGLDPLYMGNEGKFIAS